jgi:DNA-binding NtrC family response regulator
MKSLEGYKVLVVDDDPDLRELMFEAFQDAGASAQSASCGRVAIELVSKNKYDFIVSDMRMPNGDGEFLAREVSKLNGPKPLFFLYSGYNDVSEEKLVDLGIAEIFTKPFNVSKMIDSILIKLKN